MNKLTTAFLLLSLVSTTVFSQSGWNWGEQIDIAKEKNAIYTDLVKVKKYKESIEAHTWLIENTPDLNESLYQNGAKIYSGLASNEIDLLGSSKSNSVIISFISFSTFFPSLILLHIVSI